MAPAMCQYSLNLGAVSQVLSLPEGSWVCSATVDPPSVTYMHAVPPSLPSVNVISGCGVRLWVLQPQASASVPFETPSFLCVVCGASFS